MNREELMKLTKEEIIDVLFTVINDMAETIKKQAEKISELELKLKQNNKRSKKPPSSEGYERLQGRSK